MSMGPFCKVLGRSVRCILVVFSWKLRSWCFPGVQASSALVTKPGIMICYQLLSWMSTKISCAISDPPDSNVKVELEVQEIY